MFFLEDLILYFFNHLFIFYAVALLLVYLIIAIISGFELNYYLKKNRNFDYHQMLSYDRLPGVTVIAPAYNEEKSIVENVRCLLSIHYPDYEVIIVNDGSSDSTLQLIIDNYDLIEVGVAVDLKLNTQPIKRIFKSRNVAFSNLIVIDKENGGKGDSLNAGINMSSKPLFMAIDVDSIIEEDAVLKMVKPFLEEEDGKRVIASGGVVRIANSCDIENGRIVKVNFPRYFLPTFQVLEYFRTFILGRMAWSKINGLLIISGAFGMFDKQLVIDVGGYDVTTVGEDLEIVVRMRRYMHEVAKQKYKVSFIPDPLCWTEVPSEFRTLERQRNRWTRGAIDTILKHSKLLFNPKYGRLGMISYPYWLLFEWLAPLIEFAGIVYFITLAFFGLINIKTFLIVILFIFSSAFIYSMWSIFFEAYTYNKYKGSRYLFKIVLFAMLEPFIYHPLNVYFSLKGNYDFFIKRNKSGWGVMTRTSFDADKETVIEAKEVVIEAKD